MGAPTNNAFFSETTPPARTGRRLGFPQEAPDGPGYDFTWDHPNYTGVWPTPITADTTLTEAMCGFIVVCNSASPITVKLPNPIPFFEDQGNWWVRILNIGAGAVAIDSNGLDINASSPDEELVTGASAIIDTDNVGWYAMVSGVGGGGGGSTLPFEISCYAPGVYSNGELIYRCEIIRPVTFPANWSDGTHIPTGRCDANPTAPAVWTLNRLSGLILTAIGTVTWSTAGIPTFATTGGVPGCICYWRRISDCQSGRD